MPKQHEHFYDEMSKNLKPSSFQNQFFNNPVLKNSNDKEQLDRIEEKIDLLTRKIELIFGDNVIINNRFISIK